MKTFALILCGGKSERMGMGINKTLLRFGGEPAFIRSIRMFRDETDGMVLVVRKEDIPVFKETLREYGETVYAMVPGGADRQESCYNGLLAVPEDCEIVLVHDGARPFVTKAVIRNVIESVKIHGNGVAAVKSRDTVKRVDSQMRVLETLNREEVYRMQTPQGFLRTQLLEAHRNVTERCTDDASLLEKNGKTVYLTQGDYRNYKLTGPEDVCMAQAAFMPRVGYGYDAHRLVENRELWLCGVQIPYEKGLQGHSDADAPLHALTDALLGAAAMGDIGKLFPDTDEKYKGISSALLLREAYRRIRENGFTVGNCDITITAQKPKLAPYIEEMRETVARALGVGTDAVSVKATTTEKMGFEGREEGISAAAVAVLYQESGD